jgi:hypothetical protein
MRLAGANAEGGDLLTLDDTTLDMDRGASFTAVVTPAAFALAIGSGSATLRRFVQSVTITTSATVVMTPTTDDIAGASETFALAGATLSQQVQKDLDEEGQRATVSIAITAHVGQVEIGQSVQTIVPLRTAA